MFVLHLLREIERRRAFAEKSYSSLFDFCVIELGYLVDVVGVMFMLVVVLSDL